MERPDRHALLNLISQPLGPSPLRVFWYGLGTLLLLLAWDFSGLDLWMARWSGSAAGFPLESNWFWRGVLHVPMRNMGWLLELSLLVAIFRPFGALRELPVERRVQLALTPLIALIAMSGIKVHSQTSCPWDLKEFGGMAIYLSHWAWGVKDGGSGGCFPAGHASTGFAFVGGFFAFRLARPAIARRWLVVALLAGLVLGIAQQVRGAHYMSHTLWTAWLCWAAAVAVEGVVSQWIAQRPSRAPAPGPDFEAPKPLMPPASRG